MSLLRSPSDPAVPSPRRQQLPVPRPRGESGGPRRRQRVLAMVLALVMATSVSGVVASANAAPPTESAPIAGALEAAAAAPVLNPTFGPNVTVVDPSMPTSQIQA